MPSVKPIAIIPARGRSKRLPRKNILPVAGKPMIAYPIEAAINSNIFSQVIVSTEDAEIAEVASKYGARVLVRPVELAQDHSSVVEVCTHVLGLSEFDGVQEFCCIYATALLLTSETMLDAYKQMQASPVADFVMGVSSYNYPPPKALVQQDGFWKSMWLEFETKKSQEMPDFFVSNGSFYWARKSAFLDSKTFYGERLKVYENYHIDIDEPKDYAMAQKLFIDNWPNNL